MDNAKNEVYQVSNIVHWPEGWEFSVRIGDRCLIIFLTYDIKNYYLSFVISFIFDISDITSNLEFWRHFEHHMWAVSDHGQVRDFPALLKILFHW